METALLKSSLTDVLARLKEILIQQGFLIEKVDPQNRQVIAFLNGNWYRTPRHVLVELSSVNAGLTRIDVTACLDGKKKNRMAEEVMEEKIVSVIYHNF